MCQGHMAYICTKCSRGFYLVGTLCTLNCPSKYSINGNECIKPSDVVLLNITFNVITNNFTDIYGNSSFTRNQ